MCGVICTVLEAVRAECQLPGPEEDTKDLCLKSGGLGRNDLASKNQNLSLHKSGWSNVTLQCFNEFPGLYISCTSRYLQGGVARYTIWLFWLGLWSTQVKSDWC